MAYFPLFVDLKDKNVLIVGGGRVACRKVLKIIPFESKITVVAPDICDEMSEILSSNKSIKYKKKRVECEDIKEAFIVISATNDSSVNCEVANICKRYGILVNSVDDIENCSFIFPALIKKSDFVVGLSTSGKAPDVTAHLRSLIEKALPSDVETITNNIGLLRQKLKLIVGEQKIRAKIIHSLLQYYEDSDFKLSYGELENLMNNLVEDISVKG